MYEYNIKLIKTIGAYKEKKKKCYYKLNVGGKCQKLNEPMSLSTPGRGKKTKHKTDKGFQNQQIPRVRKFKINTDNIVRLAGPA